MKRGVQMYTVRMLLNDRAQVEDSLRKIKAIGYDSVQTWAPPFMTHPEYKALLDDIGLQTCSSGGEYESMLASPAAIRKAVETARVYGLDIISIGTLPEGMRESKDGFERFAEGCNKIATELKKEGMKLSYHPHALECFSLGGGLKGLDILVDNTDPDGVNFCLDTHWLTSGGVNPADWIRKVRGRMSIVHFKDYAIVGGAQKIEEVHKQFAEIGEGNIDWPPVVTACREIGVEYCIVEQDVCPGDPFASLAISYKGLERFGV